MVQFPALSCAPIDIHSHFNHGSPFDEVNSALPEEIHNRWLDFIKAGYNHIGVSHAGMSTYAAVEHPECVVEENRYLYDLVQRSNWMRQWVVVDPRIPETYRQAETMLVSDRTLGIKIHPDLHGYSILEYGDALFSFAAAHKAVVLMHPQHIAKMPAFADRYPDMKLIIAHLGSVAHVDAVADARYGNIYVDTSGGASNLNNVLEYAVSRVGSEKILFGTDTYSCAFQFGRIALSALALEEKENILFRNAIRLFPAAFRTCASAGTDIT